MVAIAVVSPYFQLVTHPRLIMQITDLIYSKNDFFFFFFSFFSTKQKLIIITYYGFFFSLTIRQYRYDLSPQMLEGTTSSKKKKKKKNSYLFSAFDFSLSSHALISDIFWVSTLSSTASEEPMN
jgi:Na+/alanine symporter